jgi:hypothetical protein
MKSETTVRMNVHTAWRCIYLLLFMASICMAILLLQKGQQVGLIFIVFSMVTGFLIKMSLSYVEADNERIVVYSPPFGMYEIRWAETETVDTNGTGYLLRGPEKTLGFNTAMGDSGARKLRDFLKQQFAEKGIAVKEVKFVPRAKPLNTMVIPENAKWAKKGNNAHSSGHGGAGSCGINPLTGQPRLKGWRKGEKPRSSDD